MPSDRSGMWSSQDEAVISSQRKNPKSRRRRHKLQEEIHRKQGRYESQSSQDLKGRNPKSSTCSLRTT
ncbi:hypothetical protein DTO207G8_595 [Paecilomyces variotii]|nr:hypothetical protein DTO207G8_595 [Paecilomyces variotii]KAJ9265659.1 hypothetical protein DTO195F2_1698 [Paecilomyces variotii]KAJ9366611.1 hypothetical protein DTO282E5_8722 [Paecilomyces variotii]KAJ9392707.1 hypothetical protein DTO063F5_507 [Paecilomyces variotii]